MRQLVLGPRIYARPVSSAESRDLLLGKQQRVVDDFHRRFYESRNQTWMDTHWLGARALKCPLDLWIYQEILWEIRPDIIIETGTFEGGTSLFLANICDLLSHGRVLSIDIEELTGRPHHPRIEYITGSSTSEQTYNAVRSSARKAERILVILDSDHSESHVFEEMTAYAPMVSPGSYLIIEDTNINGHPVLADFGPGPAEAVARFLKNHPEFETDRTREKFLLTFNPSGYLRRIR